MKHELLTLRCPVADPGGVDDAYGILIRDFLTPLNDFVRRHRIGAVCYSHVVAPLKWPLIVRLDTHFCEKYHPVPFEFPDQWTGTWDGALQFFFNADGVSMRANRSSNHEYLREHHPYLPESVYKDEEMMDWQTFCCYCFKFFEAMVSEKLPQEPKEKENIQKLKNRFAGLKKLMSAPL